MERETPQKGATASHVCPRDGSLKICGNFKYKANSWSTPSSSDPIRVEISLGKELAATVGSEVWYVSGVASRVSAMREIHHGGGSTM